MNMKRIDAAIRSYEGALGAEDENRLAFFRSLWERVARAGEEHRGYGDDAPSSADVRRWHAAGIPVFSRAGAPVDFGLLARTSDDLTLAARESGLFPAEVEAAMAQTMWERVYAACDERKAGADPAAFLMELEQVLVDDGKTASAAHVLALFAQLALRSQLEASARTAAALLPAASSRGARPLACPVCGGAPALAQVGGATSSNGRGRVLHCLQCGASWEFERVRCARCGTTNQAHLHYHHIEGDDAHRIASCDECGGYIRTVFLEDALFAVCPEVEDVVMAKLDAVAARFGGFER